MDPAKYTTLVEALATLSDPRRARGKRYPWLWLLTLIALAMASGQRSPHAMADWVARHWEELLKELQPDRLTCPSEATFRRALRGIVPQQIEDMLSHWAHEATHPETAPLVAQAVDGKEVRGVRAHGEKLHLVSLVRHADAITLAQTAVDQKSNEITAVPQLLAGRDLTHTVTTMDALLTQRSIAQQIRRQKGHYFMVVKANHPELYQALELLFAHPPWTRQERTREYVVMVNEGKGHGRLERRRLEASSTLCAYVGWPDVGQVLRRTCRRVSRKTGEVSQTVTYAITSLTPQQAKAEQLEAIWRGHWTIENRVHYVRDMTLGEDACQVYAGQAPRVLAALRNAILNLFRACGWTNISDAIRYYASSVVKALGLISLQPARL